MPAFSHLPLILKPTGKGKLSKRDGQKLGIPVFPMEWSAEGEIFPGFKEMGFIPDAMINFLALLGWSPGTDEEIFSEHELIKLFSLEQVGKSGARFDFEKAKWVNQQHILNCSDDVLLNAMRETLAKKSIEAGEDKLKQYVKLFRPRIELLTEIYDVGYYMFEDIHSYNFKIVHKKWKDNSASVFGQIIDKLNAVTDWSAPTLKEKVSTTVQESGVGFGAILPLMRVALCGDVKGPDLFETMSLLGNDTVLGRLKDALGLFSELEK